MIRKLIILGFLFFVSCAPSNYSEIKVVEVIDGDTVRLSNGKVLRYIGLDTPETRIKRGGKFVYGPQPFSLQATNYNRSLVEGKKVKIEFDLVKKDRYGRLLGYCFVEGVFVNAKLIEQGYAVIYTFPPNVKYSDLFYQLQVQARESQKGLWAGYEVIDHTQANQYLNQVATVSGLVAKAYKSKKCIFLNFGNNWKTDFTVVIFPSSYDYFHQKGIDPLTFYTGKLVQVSGRVREYNGPEIIVNTPYEIEILEHSYE